MLDALDLPELSSPLWLFFGLVVCLMFLVSADALGRAGGALLAGLLDGSPIEPEELEELINSSHKQKQVQVVKDEEDSPYVILRAQRKPMLALRWVGRTQLRKKTAIRFAGSLHAPPRITLYWPVSGPLGLSAGELL